MKIEKKDVVSQSFMSTVFWFETSKFLITRTNLYSLDNTMAFVLFTLHRMSIIYLKSIETKCLKYLKSVSAIRARNNA